MKKRVNINRAPVLTLWAEVVAERLGYGREAALTLAKAVTGLNAQAKGRRLGIFNETKGRPKKEEAKTRGAGAPTTVTLLGRPVPVVHTAAGIRAAIKGDPIDPESVQRYLAQKFGDDLGDVRLAMEVLAKSYEPEKLAGLAYTLYEEFRPSVPEGERGWGAKGELNLDLIRSLGRKSISDGAER